MAEPLVISDEDAFELLMYLVSSAEISFIEPAPKYGVFRLLDASSKLMGAMLKQGATKHKALLKKLKQEVDEKKILMIWDEDGFRQFVNSVPGKVAEELKKST